MCFFPEKFTTAEISQYPECAHVDSFIQLVLHRNSQVSKFPSTPLQLRTQMQQKDQDQGLGRNLRSMKGKVVTRLENLRTRLGT